MPQKKTRVLVWGVFPILLVLLCLVLRMPQRLTCRHYVAVVLSNDSTLDDKLHALATIEYFRWPWAAPYLRDLIVRDGVEQELHWHVVSALGELRDTSEANVTLLQSSLKDRRYPRSRIDAALALGKLGKDAYVAVGDLEEARSDPDLADAAEIALERIRSDSGCQRAGGR